MKLANTYAKIMLERFGSDSQTLSIDLVAIKDAIFSDKKIARFFTSAINKHTKHIMLDKIAKQYKISSMVVQLLKYMVDSGSLHILPDVIKSYHHLLSGTKSVIVTVSQNTSKSDKTYIQNLLEERFGYNLDITYVVDPSIIGGMVVRFGNILLDTSIRGYCQNLAMK